MPVHANSIVSFYNTDRDTRYRAILACYEPEQLYTDRKVCFMLGFSDLNAVRPRITELIDKGILIEAGKTMDMLTQRQVRQTRLANPQQQIEMGI